MPWLLSLIEKKTTWSAYERDSKTMADKVPKETYGVLPKKLGGGPHGLGDPDDKSLRKVEKDVCVMQKLRDKTRKEKCPEVVKEFTECCKESGLFMVFECRSENTALKACLAKWYKDEDFIAECTREYLEERSEYRRTGITKKQKAFANRIANSM